MKSLSRKSGVVLLFFFAIFVYGEAWGADWKAFGSDSNTVSFYDKENISHSSNDIVRVSIKVVYTPAGVSDLVHSYGQRYRGLDHKVSLFELNCKDKMIRLLSSTWYWADGREITPYSNPNDKWYSIDPESSLDSLRKEVCR